MLRDIVLIIVLALNAGTAHATAFDHSPWDGLLQKNVVVHDGGRATTVDYQAMTAERTILTGYLEQLTQVSRTQFDSWPKDEQTWQLTCPWACPFRVAMECGASL